MNTLYFGTPNADFITETLGQYLLARHQHRPILRPRDSILHHIASQRECRCVWVGG